MTQKLHPAEKRMRDAMAKVIYGELLQVSMPAAERCADKLIAYWRSTLPVKPDSVLPRPDENSRPNVPAK